jgi:hypothetical protein
MLRYPRARPAPREVTVAIAASPGLDRQSRARPVLRLAAVPEPARARR